MGAGKVSVKINSMGDDLAIYNAFKEIVSGAKVLDGDLRLNNDTLEKVNFGGLARRMISSANDLCNQQAGDSTDIKDKLIRGLTARLNGMTGISQEQKEALINRLKLIVGNDGNIPLSRRTVSLVVQIVESKGENAEDVLNGMYNGMTWKMVGGPQGMRMTQTQFETMFDEAMKIAVKKNAKDKLGLETALKYYTDQFKNTNNGADLERFVTGSLDAKTIADKMIAHLQEGLIPSKKNKDRTNVQCDGVLSQAIRTKIEAVRQAEMLYGSRAISKKIDISGMIQDRKDVDPATAAKNFASEILLNTDMREVAFSGFSDGERIGRYLLKNAGAFHRICDSVIARETVAAANKKNPKVQREMPPECDEIKSLRLVSTELAEDFTALISHLAKSVLVLKPGERDEDLSRRLVEKADSIYTAISDFKATVGGKEVKGFERIIEGRLAERMFGSTGDESTSLLGRFYGELYENYFDEKYDTNARMIHMILQKSPPSTLRRMFAFSLRENRCDLNNEKSWTDEKFSYAGMIRGLGPLATKLIQGMNPEAEAEPDDDPVMDDEDVKKKNIPDEYGIRKAMLATCGDNPDVNPEIIRAVIYDILQSKDVEFDSVKVTKAAGAGSVAQALMCTVYSGNEAPAEAENNVNKAKDIIIKVIRPDIKAEFDSEVEAIRSVVKGEGDDADRKAAAFPITPNTWELMSRDINNCLVPFVNDISSEVDPKSELINALKGLQTYGQPGDGNSQDNQVNSVMRQWNLGNGAKVDVKSTVGVGSERLILKKGIDLEKPFKPGGAPTGEYIVNQLNNCREDRDFEKVLEDFFVCDNEYSMLIESAKGSDISTVIHGYESAINKAMENIVSTDGRTSFSTDEINKLEILENRNELVDLSRSFAVLSEKFVNGALFAKTPFVHGDLQPGNIRYDKTTGGIVLIDYGKAMTLKPVESDALKILFQMERRQPTPVDADLMLEAYLSLVDSEIARLEGDGNADPVKLDALKNVKNDLGTNRGKEEFRIACRQFDGDRAKTEKNVFQLLTDMLQNRELPVPKALVMFNGSYSRLLRTANTINDTIEKYDRAIGKSLLGVAEGAKGALDALSKDGTLCLDNIGFVNCTVGNDGLILVSERDVSPDGGGSHPLSAVLRELSNSIFDTKNHVPLSVRRQAATDAIVLLEHEQSRLQEFQEQFGVEDTGDGSKSRLVATLAGYGLHPNIQVSPLSKCDAALKNIGEALDKLGKFVQTLDASGFDYDDGIFQMSFLGSVGDRRKLDERFGGESSEWRQRKSVADELDYVLGAVVKDDRIPAGCRSRFNELVVQSDLSWPQKFYLLTKDVLSGNTFDWLSQKLSSRNQDAGTLIDDKKINQYSLGFDENANLTVLDGDMNHIHVEYVDGKDYNKLMELAKALEITLPKSLDEKYEDKSIVGYDKYAKLLINIVESEIPTENQVPGSKEADMLLKELTKNTDVSIMRCVRDDISIAKLPKEFPLRKEYESNTRINGTTVREVGRSLYDKRWNKDNDKRPDFEEFLAGQLTIDLDEKPETMLVSAEILGDSGGNGVNALDVYVNTLNDINKEMPDNLKLTIPKDGATFNDLKNLQDYKIPLKENDIKEFDQMLEKLEGATSDFKERISAYRDREKNNKLTRGDFKRLVADINQTFSGSSLASTSIEKKYDKVREFMEKVLPFDPPPFREGRITLAAYGDLIQKLKHQTANSFIEVPSGAKLGIAGADLVKELTNAEKADVKLNTIGDVKRAYNNLFEPGGLEKYTRLKDVMKNPADENVPVDKTQNIPTDDSTLEKLVEVASNEKLGLPVPNIKGRKSVPIDEVKALYREVKKIEETQPRINDIPGIAANLFRGNRPESGQGGNAPAWDLTKRPDTSLHFKSYAPLDVKNLKFADNSAYSIWSEGLDGQIMTGAKESYIAYSIALDPQSVKSSPELKDRMERMRQEVVDKTLTSVRDSRYTPELLKTEKDFNDAYQTKCQECLKGAADGARYRLFEMDKSHNYVHNDKLFVALRQRIDSDPNAFKFDKLDVNNPNHIMLLEAGLLI